MVMCAEGAYAVLRCKIRTVNSSGMVIFKKLSNMFCVFCFEGFPILQTNPISGVSHLFGAMVIITGNGHLALGINVHLSKPVECQPLHCKSTRPLGRLWWNPKTVVKFSLDIRTILCWSNYFKKTSSEESEWSHAQLKHGKTK